MKKTLVSALTTALVVGAASTTFAAANPFSDVPANSWAYNAVATLARDGVVNGFPNGTFQGQKTMTRYEMAQIVAKAMAYENMTKADKAIVDKLAAEFSQELNNLGVRVSNLEKKSDNVKFTGKVQYQYTKVKDEAGEQSLKFRLDPSAQINDNWTAHARLDYNFTPDKDTKNTNGVTVDRAYVSGKVGAATVNLGKTPAFLANGLVLDDTMTGALVAVGNDKTTVALAAGRYTVASDIAVPGETKKHNEDLQKEIGGMVVNPLAVEVSHKFSDKVAANAGYFSIRKGDVEDFPINTWYVGTDATVAKDLALHLEYAQSNKKDDVGSNQNRAYNVELGYKGEDASQAGSFGAYAAYRHLGFVPAMLTTYGDGVAAGQKGYELGVAYVPAQNVVTTVKYFNGKNIVNNSRAHKLFASAEFLF